MRPTTSVCQLYGLFPNLFFHGKTLESSTVGLNQLIHLIGGERRQPGGHDGRIQRGGVRGAVLSLRRGAKISSGTGRRCLLRRGL